jgi:hypothetical protein
LSYFTDKNKKEVGPGVAGKQVMYLVVEDPTVTGSNNETRFAIVWATSGFGAREEARKMIPDFKDQAFICYPNPVRYNGE